MEPTAAPPLHYADSLDSSPRSRNADSWDDPLPPANKLRVMCSFDGHIVPRPHGKSLCYVGGGTRMVVLERSGSLSELCVRLREKLLKGRGFTMKYQLPNEDLDSLISVTTDEDLENMIDEIDRTAGKARIRLFLFPVKPDSSQSMGPMLDMEAKSEDWFLNAINGGGNGQLSRGFSDSASVECLLGLDDNGGGANNSESTAEKNGRVDVHSVTDLPMLENSSSFGSTSSCPSLTNLPPIGVHVEDQKAAGIEDQFAQMTVGITSAPPLPTTTMQVNSFPAPEYLNRAVSDEERSDHGGYRKPVAPPQPQSVQLPAPDSVSSDHSLSRPKPVVYQEPVAQIQSGTPTRYPANVIDSKVNVSDVTACVQIQQHLQDPGYLLQNQYDHQLQQQQQLLRQQQQHQQQQQQQYVHAGSHYVQHQPGSVPIQAYYPVHPSQQPQQHHHHPQLDQHQQQYQVYYMPARQAPTYNNMPLQQSLQPNMNEPAGAATITSSRSQAPPNSMLSPTAAYTQVRNAPIAKPELAAGAYRTIAAAAAAAPSLIQVRPSQHQPQQQYVSYAQVHPSQSAVPTSTVSANYAYEYADASHAQHAQIYYTQPLAHTMPSQYQTMTGSAAMGLPEAQLPNDGSTKQLQQQQQQRSQ